MSGHGVTALSSTTKREKEQAQENQDEHQPFNLKNLVISISYRYDVLQVVSITSMEAESNPQIKAHANQTKVNASVDLCDVCVPRQKSGQGEDGNERFFCDIAPENSLLHFI